MSGETAKRRSHGWIGIILIVTATMLWWSLRYDPETAAIVVGWVPALLEGFLVNIAMSIVAMALATILGVLLGAALIAPAGPARRIGRLITGFLRNAPWLVMMFFIMYLIPYEIVIGGHFIRLSDFAKACVGIALPAAGYVAEMVRGAIQSVDRGQWDAAAALGLNHRRTLRLVILPQTLRTMVPPWMNIYCAVMMATSLASTLSVREMMSNLADRLASETSPDLLLPAYGLTFLIFFLFIYPISRLSRRLERQWRIAG